MRRSWAAASSLPRPHGSACQASERAKANQFKVLRGGGGVKRSSRLSTQVGDPRAGPVCVWGAYSWDGRAGTEPHGPAGAVLFPGTRAPAAPSCVASALGRVRGQAPSPAPPLVSSASDFALRRQSA